MHFIQTDEEQNPMDKVSDSHDRIWVSIPLETKCFKSIVSGKQKHGMVNMLLGGSGVTLGSNQTSMCLSPPCCTWAPGAV